MDREEAMKPRVLVVEDDPVSRAFFRDVLSGLPAEVDAVAGCGAAEACALAQRHALWLVDAHLPDGDAVGLLPRLRAHDAAAVAMAHTASRDAALHRTLLGAGYIEVLVKPVTVGTLLSTVGRNIRMQVREPRAPFGPGASTAPASVADDGSPWNDGAALSALGGDASHVQALRAMFTGELADTVARIEAALQLADAATARALLHRLASGCAFTGALSLGDAVRRLHDDPADATVLAAFRTAASRLL